MPNYRDYGYIGTNSSQAILEPVDEIRRTQVFIATHDGAGEYLPFMKRSFISFSYGGKNIEDFNLIATIDGNFMQKGIYAPFTDNVTESEVFDGQIYWNTHFDAHGASFTLSTDGMTERQLDEFRIWFMPGKIKELILAERPNLGIWARVAEVPEYNMLPFEHKITTKIGGFETNTSTTLYKGSISLSLIMDDPFWHSIHNILDAYDTTTGAYISGQWKNANNNTTPIRGDQDAAKLIFEDGIPYSDMMEFSNKTVHFGTSDSVEIDTSNDATGSLTYIDNTGGATADNGHVYPYLITGASRLSVVGKIQLGITKIMPYEGVNVDSSDAINNNKYYFYYAGTAPCYPKLTFSLTPRVGASVPYIYSPHSPEDNTEIDYSYIRVTSVSTNEFKFIAPSIWTGYNRAYSIIRATQSRKQAWEEIRQLIRDNVKHFAPRAYAIAAINYVVKRSGNEIVNSEDKTAILNLLKLFICDLNSDEDTSTNELTIMPATFVFDGKNGIARGTFSYRNNNIGDPAIKYLTEDVGDMIVSDYLQITDRNVLDDNGYIQPWSASHPTYGHYLSHNISNGIQNVQLEYKYLYL